MRMPDQGNATRDWIGGLVVASCIDLADLPWTGVACAVLTVLTALFYIYLQKRQAQTVNV